jgi:uncharacterized phiE125 gp8 family phage protein
MTTFLTTSSLNRPWDDGIRWHLEQSADEGPDFALDPLELDFVRDQHLRSPNGNLEDEYIEWLIRASYRQAEKWTNRALIRQTFRLISSGFPWGDFYLPKGPVLSVDAIDYFDGTSSAAALGGSPAEFVFTTPLENKHGRLRPLAGSSWPSAYSQEDAVTVTFQAGYPTVDGVAAIPEDITDGRLIWIGERYKQRSLTDHAFNQNKAAIQARALWMQYRIYG